MAQHTGMVLFICCNWELFKTDKVFLIFFGILTRKLKNKGQWSWRKYTKYGAVIIIATNTIKMTPKLYY